MRDECPLVGIGMPVYNGGGSSPQAGVALEPRTIPIFSLSSPITPPRSHRSDLPRVSRGTGASATYASGKIAGSPWNFAFVAREARGDYFSGPPTTILAPHVPSKVRESSRCSSGSRALLYGNQSGRRAWRSVGALPQLQEHRDSGNRRVDRIHALLSLPGWFASYGLMRREILQKLSLGLSVFAWDVILLLEILLMGPSAKVPETLFTFRVAEPRNAQEYAQIFQKPGRVHRHAVRRRGRSSVGNRLPLSAVLEREDAGVGPLHCGLSKPPVAHNDRRGIARSECPRG